MDSKNTLICSKGWTKIGFSTTSGTHLSGEFETTKKNRSLPFKIYVGGCFNPYATVKLDSISPIRGGEI